MENGVFQDSAVAEELTNFIEARLHVDGAGEKYEAQLALHQEMNETTSRPFYVVLDPASREPIARFRRALVPGESPQVFIDFLRKARGV